MFHRSFEDALCSHISYVNEFVLLCDGRSGLIQVFEENVPQILKFVTIDLEIHTSNGQMNKVHLPFAFFVASNAFPGMFFLHYIYFCV